MKKLLFVCFSLFLSLSYAQTEGGAETAPLDELEEKLDGAYEKVTLKEREIIAYDHLREADIKWKKRVWRVLDFQEKLNLPFAHPKMGLVNIIHEAAKKGEIEVYAASDAGEVFKEPMNVQDVAQIGASVDTVSRINFETGVEERVVTANTFNPETVKKLRIKEDWLFDIETSTMLVRILGMSFMREKYNENGDYVGDIPMYWVYYPDVRKILATNQVYNIKNDANTTSWEDIFEMRYFNSYIMKESNVFDRRIDAYATNLDLLYESDRIHNEIRDKESDFWEY
ncbi:MAG: gliding motility protein GldN [Chitinophagales bacterium]|nr:gliding motility protein GldN [Chitinophagales bacterium]